MTVQIIINGENAAESIKELTTLAAAIGGQAPVTVDKPVSKSRVKPASATTIKDVTEETSVNEVDEVNYDGPDDAEEVEEEIPTAVELRAKAQELGAADASNKPKIKALLNKFGSKSITDIPENKRVAFMAGLDAI